MAGKNPSKRVEEALTIAIREISDLKSKYGTLESEYAGLHAKYQDALEKIKARDRRLALYENANSPRRPTRSNTKESGGSASRREIAARGRDPQKSPEDSQDTRGSPGTTRQQTKRCTTFRTARFRHAQSAAAGRRAASPKSATS